MNRSALRALRALRALTRVELRQLLRNRARSALCLALVALPVAALTVGSALLRMTGPTHVERRAQIMGRAALRVDVGGNAPASQAVALLPAHARHTTLFSGQLPVRVPGRRLAARWFAISPSALEPAGLAAGMLHVTVGRAPQAADEVALSAVLLNGLGRSVGERITLLEGAATITGVVEAPENLDLPVLLSAPDPDRPLGAPSLLVGLPEDEAAALASRLRAEGLTVTEGADVEHSDPFEVIALFVAGAFGFFEAGLVIAAAFAVSLRRRRREIGLLGANGASPDGIAASLTVSAASLALAGGLLGAAVGAGAAAACHPFLDDWNRRANGPFELAPWPILGAQALGLLAATLAVALPARSATRLPLRLALGGRRPVTSPSGRLLGLGLVLLVGGCLVLLLAPEEPVVPAAVAILAGSMSGVLGFGVAAPGLLDRLSRLATPLPLAWRLAVRDAGRFRSRNGPVVTAVLAGMSISVLIGALLASLEQASVGLTPGLRDDVLLVDGPEAEALCRQLASELDVVGIAALRSVTSGGETLRVVVDDAGLLPRHDDWVAVGDAELLAALGAADAAPALEAGRLVALRKEPAEGAIQTFELPAIDWIEPGQSVRAPTYLLGRAALNARGLGISPPPRHDLVPWLVRLAAPVTAGDLQRSQRLAAATVATVVDAQRLHGKPTGGFLGVVLALSIGTGLLVVFVATALSSAESANDRRVLHAVGGSPQLMRRHVAARAGYLAALGGLLAVPAGLLPFFGLASLSNFPLRFVMPWFAAGMAVLVLPVVAYGGSWLFAGARRAGSPAAT